MNVAKILEGIDLQELRERLGRTVDGLTRRVLRVSIMGQTGVGKSSLLNALFGTSLATDAVRPCTKQIEQRAVVHPADIQSLPRRRPGIATVAFW